MALSDNLRAYWKLDESSGNAADATGNGNTGVNTGTALFVSGKLNNGADLETSSTQYFSVADNPSLSITGDLSFSCWFRAESFGEHGVFSKYAGAGARSYAVRFNSSTSVDAVIQNSAQAETYVNWSISALSTGTWYHLVWVYTASSHTWDFYINGSAQTQKDAVRTNIGDFGGEFRLGNGNAAGASLDGILDEGAIWARALSSMEVTALYNSGNPLPYPFTTEHTKTLDETAVATATFSRAWTLARTLTETATSVAALIKTAANVLIGAITAADEVMNAQPQSAGPNSPGTMGQIDEDGPRDWDNQDNAKISNNAYTTVSLDASDIQLASQPLTATNFGFSIPSTATIDGVLVEIERKANNADELEDNQIRLLKAGVRVGDDKASLPWLTSEEYISYGGVGDLWGTTWTPAEINASNFGVAISVVITGDDSGTASIDHIRITIHYTLSGNLYSETYDEAVTAAASLLKSTTRSLSESPIAAATFARLWTTARTLSETITSTASIIRTNTRTLIEAITASDTVTGFIAFARTLSEAVTATPAFLRSLSRTFSDALEAADEFTGFRARVATLSDEATAVATLIKTGRRTLSEGVTAVASFVGAFGRILTDTVTATDTLATVRGYVRTMADSVTGIDTFSRAVTYARSLIENVTAQANVRKLLNGVEVLWTNLTRAAASFANRVRNTASWTPRDRGDADWENRARGHD